MQLALKSSMLRIFMDPLLLICSMPKRMVNGPMEVASKGLVGDMRPSSMSILACLHISWAWARCSPCRGVAQGCPDPWVIHWAIEQQLGDVWGGCERLLLEGCGGRQGPQERKAHEEIRRNGVGVVDVE